MLPRIIVYIQCSSPKDFLLFNYTRKTADCSWYSFVKMEPMPSEVEHKRQDDLSAGYVATDRSEAN